MPSSLGTLPLALQLLSSSPFPPDPTALPVLTLPGGEQWRRMWMELGTCQGVCVRVISPPHPPQFATLAYLSPSPSLEFCCSCTTSRPHWVMVYGLLGGAPFPHSWHLPTPLSLPWDGGTSLTNFVKNNWLSSASYLGTAEILHAVAGLYAGRPASAQGCRWGG